MARAKQPVTIPGPDGCPLTVWDLPLSHDSRWTPLRKARIVVAVQGGLISADEACGRYDLSIDELEIWQREFQSGGTKGLRVTRIKRRKRPDSKKQ
jgi:Protein of unknown function (DUF1153)